MISSKDVFLNHTDKQLHIVTSTVYVCGELKIISVVSFPKKELLDIDNVVDYLQEVSKVDNHLPIKVSSSPKDDKLVALFEDAKRIRVFDHYYDRNSDFFELLVEQISGKPNSIIVSFQEFLDNFEVGGN
jgi:hypothetical protein